MNERKSWSEQEDQLIKKFINSNSPIKWCKVLSSIKQLQPHFTRTSKQIRQRLVFNKFRWKYHLDPKLKKQSLNPQEQEIIFKAHTLNGSKWKQIQKLLPGRSQKCIRNFYYMTLRKCLRRVTKILGAKNSTIQSRQFKPHVISKIIESLNQRPQKRQCIYRLIKLNKIKSGECKKSLLQKQDIQIFQQLVDELLYYNELYIVNKQEGKQALELKINNLKSINLGFEKGYQNSVKIGASTIPSIQEQENSQILRQISFSDQQFEDCKRSEDKEQDPKQEQFSFGQYFIKCQQSDIFQK